MGLLGSVGFVRQLGDFKSLGKGGGGGLWHCDLPTPDSSSREPLHVVLLHRQARHRRHRRHSQARGFCRGLGQDVRLGQERDLRQRELWDLWELRELRELRCLEEAAAHHSAQGTCLQCHGLGAGYNYDVAASMEVAMQAHSSCPWHGVEGLG